MTFPKYKVETYTGALLDHTITSDATVYFKESLTDAVGLFSILVPNGGSYTYKDIALHDKVKIYVDYDSVPVNLNFTGYVTMISGYTTNRGFMRRIDGLSQGEILLRRFKTNTYLDGETAHDIVDDVIAADLGLGDGDIGVEATAETHEVRTMRYFDLLKNVSDYYDAGGNVTKDFYVDIDNDLVWDDRPLRAAGVETLTVGGNIKSYNVIRDVAPVKNNITVYGAAESWLPADKDGWSEALTNWAADAGTLSLQASPLGVDAWSIRCNNAVGNIDDFTLDMPTKVTIRDINHLRFWAWVAAIGVGDGYVMLYAPGSSGAYFQATVPKDGAWTWYDLPLGPQHVYDADENEDGVWTMVGAPNWWDIDEIRFYADFGAVGQSYYVNLLHFYPVRWSDTASDGGSQASYGRRDMEVTDDNLHSDAACEVRSETLLYQLKDPPTQIDVVVTGNNNVLAGDRLSMTIPSEDIAAASYDVFSVEQTFDDKSWLTSASMMNSANIRRAVDTQTAQMVGTLRVKLNELARDLKALK